MTCFHPKPAWQIRHKRSDKNRIKMGAVPPSVSTNPAYFVEAIQVPCRQCISCRLKKTSSWMLRILHEQQYWETSCFITLTYDQLPMHGSLVKSDLQKFFKRFRKTLDGEIKYFSVGEYGEKLFRPHYHACIFGFDFGDRKFFKWNKGQPIFISEHLAQLWPGGFHSVQSLTADSAAYVARYCQKKVNGKEAADHYERPDPISSAPVSVLPEYQAQSLGIGKQFCHDYLDEIIANDSITYNGREYPVPEYYDTIIKNVRPDAYEVMKHDRRVKAEKFHKDMTPERLRDREKHLEKKFRAKVRPLEAIEDTQNETGRFLNIRSEGESLSAPVLPAEQINGSKDILGLR